MGDREGSDELSMERVEKESGVALEERVFTVGEVVEYWEGVSISSLFCLSSLSFSFSLFRFSICFNSSFVCLNSSPNFAYASSFAISLRLASPLTLTPSLLATFLLKLPSLNKIFHPHILNFPLDAPTIFIAY